MNTDKSSCSDRVGLKLLLLVGMMPGCSVLAQAAGEPIQRSVLLGIAQTQQKAVGDSVESLTNLGYSQVSIDKDEQTSSGSIGYRHPLTPSWSLDLNYLDHGKIRPRIQATLPVGKTRQQAARDIAEFLPERGRGISAVGLYHRSLGGSWIGHVGAGAFVWRSEREASVNGAYYRDTTSGVSPVVQLGVSRPLTRRTRFEGYGQHFFMPDKAVQRLGVGLSISF